MRLYRTTNRSLPGSTHDCPARFVLHAAISIAAQARLARRRCAARLAKGSNWNVICRACRLGGCRVARSSAIDRQCIKFARITLAKASGLATILLASWAAQQQKCDQRNRNLNANGVLGGSEKMADFQDLLDPSEEQLDRPATFVQISDVSRAGGQIIGKDTQRLAGLDH